MLQRRMPSIPFPPPPEPVTRTVSTSVSTSTAVRSAAQTATTAQAPASTEPSARITSEARVFLSLLLMGMAGPIAQARMDAMSMESRRQVFRALTERLRDDEKRLVNYQLRVREGKPMQRLTLWTGGLKGINTSMRLLWYSSIWLSLSVTSPSPTEESARRVKSLGVTTIAVAPIRIWNHHFDRMSEREAFELAQRIRRVVDFAEKFEKKNFGGSRA